MRASYQQERRQVEQTAGLARRRLLSSAVAHHALVLIDGLGEGVFRSGTMRALVGAEQRWKELAQLPESSQVVESLSNMLVQHVEGAQRLPCDATEFAMIGEQCARDHHTSVAQHQRYPTQLQRVARATDRLFQCYARLLSELARIPPRTEEWYECAAHTISAAVALGGHLDWIGSLTLK